MNSASIPGFGLEACEGSCTVTTQFVGNGYRKCSTGRPNKVVPLKFRGHYVKVMGAVLFLK